MFVYILYFYMKYITPNNYVFAEMYFIFLYETHYTK